MGGFVARGPEDYDRFRLALVPVDEAMWASEQRWGVGRLERLVSGGTLAAWRRGWTAWRAAIEAVDWRAAETVGPLMVRALGVMDLEATALGCRPLAVETWEAALPGDTAGTVLVVVRSSAEASAVLRGGSSSVDELLPVDVALTVRQQAEGRRIEVWTMAEVARLVARHGSAARVWEGTVAASGRVMDEMAAHDLARSGYPLAEPLGADVAPVAALPF